MSNNIFTLGPTPDTVRAAHGEVLTAPQGWVLFPPGDAVLTHRVKAAGERWVVQEKKGRKTFSKGVFAPAGTVARIRRELEAERSTDASARKRAADAQRREKTQSEYVEDFYGSVLTFLDFHSDHLEMAQQISRFEFIERNESRSAAGNSAEFLARISLKASCSRSLWNNRMRPTPQVQHAENHSTRSEMSRTGIGKD